MSKETRSVSRREVLEGALVASAGAVALWALPAGAQKLQTGVGAPAAVAHSSFAGGAALAASTPVFANINGLIGHISQQTKVAPETVHSIISMAYPSIAQFIGRTGNLSPGVLARIKVAI